MSQDRYKIEKALEPYPHLLAIFREWYVPTVTVEWDEDDAWVCVKLRAGGREYECRRTFAEIAKPQSDDHRAYIETVCKRRLLDDFAEQVSV